MDASIFFAWQDSEQYKAKNVYEGQWGHPDLPSLAANRASGGLSPANLVKFRQSELPVIILSA
jgi:hypothetical protein